MGFHKWWTRLTYRQKTDNMAGTIESTDTTLLEAGQGCHRFHCVSVSDASVPAAQTRWREGGRARRGGGRRGEDERRQERLWGDVVSHGRRLSVCQRLLKTGSLYLTTEKERQKERKNCPCFYECPVMKLISGTLHGIFLSLSSSSSSAVSLASRSFQMGRGCCSISQGDVNPRCLMLLLFLGLYPLFHLRRTKTHSRASTVGTEQVQTKELTTDDNSEQNYYSFTTPYTMLKYVKHVEKTLIPWNNFD